MNETLKIIISTPRPTISNTGENSKGIIGISTEDFLKIIAKSDCKVNLSSLTNATDGSTPILVSEDVYAKPVEHKISDAQLQSKLVGAHDHCYFNKSLLKYSDIPGTSTNDKTEVPTPSGRKSVEKCIKIGKNQDPTGFLEKKQEERRIKRMNKIMHYKRRIETERDLAKYYSSQTWKIRSTIRKLRRQTEDSENLQKQKLFLWDFD